MVSFVVMYDASGIRRAAGVTAERVNALPDGLWESAYDKPLKESLGHSRLQVLVGSLIGPAVALPGLISAPPPLPLICFAMWQLMTAHRPLSGRSSAMHAPPSITVSIWMLMLARLC